MKSKKEKIGMIVILLLGNSCLLAQEKPDTLFSKPYQMFFQAGYQYREMPDVWRTNMVGILAEVRFTQKFGLSGSLLYGKGSNNTEYIHVPIPGIFIAFMFYMLGNRDSALFRLLIIENVHYYYTLNKNFIVSPYFNLLGADLSDKKGGHYSDKTHVLFSLGPGLNTRTILFNRMTIGFDFGLKYFLIDGKEDFGRGNRIGYTAGMNIGLVF